MFENVSFIIDTDWKLGFIGRNGRGKTTFLNLMLGKYNYTGIIQSGVPFDYFPYCVDDKSQCAADIIKQLCPETEEWELLREISLLCVNDDILCRPFETLSNGEQTKILLAALFVKPNRFLLIDEPTNHLDAEARKNVGAYLQKKKGFILVSHDRELLDSCVDHILSINRSNIEVRQGNFSSWWENKRMQDESELAEDIKLKKEIARLSDAAKRSADWSDKVESTKNGTRNSGLRPDRGFIGHKAAKMMKQAKSQENRMQSAIEAKSDLLKNTEQTDALKMSPLPYIKDTLITANRLDLSYSDTPVCRDISFRIRQGDRIAVTGKNGCGKSTLLKLICGEKIHCSGDINIGSGIKISYVFQDASGMCGSIADYAERLAADESLIKATLRKMGFERIQLEKDMSDLSEGQKKKVLIAGSLCEHAHLYVWDEPLNYIDVITRMQIEDLILQYKPTMLFVEHDGTFVKKIATDTIRL